MTDDRSPRDRARSRAETRRRADRAVAWRRHEQVKAGQKATRVPGRAYNKLEARLAALMDEWGIDYRWQFRLGRFVYDFLLPDRNIVEVHGSYFHADPRFHPDESLTPGQKRTRLHDIRKQHFAAGQGYRYRVVWEHDLIAGRVGRSDIGME